MGPDETLSPALLKKVIHAATSAASYQQAEDDLRALAEVEVSANRIHRAAERVGAERIADRAAATAAYEKLPLPRWRTSPGPAPPEVACVQVDGGRLQMRPRAAEADAPDSWWRETKVGCLLAMTSERHAEDPAPQVPATFVDPARMAKLSREIKGMSGEPPAREAAEAAETAERHAPEVVAQTVVATTEKIEAFGAMLVARAHALGFSAAARKAFVADGSEANWGVWRRWFSHYTPILDWVHAICYVYAAATAGAPAEEGWADYCRWAQWLWSGEIDLLLAALRQRQERIGEPTDDDAETSPRRRVADALRYLDNQRSRMDYPAYRRAGLPISSSHVESTIKRINRRVKGTEKFWDRGAEPLLQLVADRLSPPEPTEQFWNDRPKRLRSYRCYQSAA